MIRLDIQIAASDGQDEVPIRAAMSKALDAMSAELGERFPWEAIAFDQEGDAFDSAGHDGEAV